MADELIWRSDVIDAIYSRNKALLRDEQYKRKRGDIDLLGVIGNINAIPTIEAEPIRHGYWKDVEPTLFRNRFATCSECGVRQLIDKDNFCPNCGAKMGRMME